MSYVILTESGLGVTHNTTRNKVYEATLHIPSEGRYIIRNDDGIRQDVFQHNFFEIPKGSFIGAIKEGLVASEVGIVDCDYVHGKPYVMKVIHSTPHQLYEFTDDAECSRKPFAEAVEVLADPWGVVNVPARAKFFPQRRLRLLESVGPFHAGDDVFAHSTNINGSYMVPSPYGSGSVIVKPQICTVIEPGMIQAVKYPKGFQVDNKLTGAKQPQPFQIQHAPKGVKKQKSVAQELLTYAFMMDPQAFMAGGAPRNWHLGLMANDLDIFIRKPYQASESECKLAMERMGITDIFNKANEEAPGVKKKNRYSQENVNEDKRASDQKIEFVLEGQYMGETIQFIFLEYRSMTGLAYCHRYFDTSINMISVRLDTEGELFTAPSPRFDDSMKTGVIFVQENGSAYGNGDHLKRIHEYFPEAPMVREKYREEVLRNPEKAFKLAEDWEDLI